MLRSETTKTVPQTFRIAEAAEYLSISRAAAFRAAKAGELPVLVIGGVRLVPRAALDAMLADPAICAARGTKTEREQ